jgi:hypothetical protein
MYIGKLYMLKINYFLSPISLVVKEGNSSPLNGKAGCVEIFWTNASCRFRCEIITFFGSQKSLKGAVDVQVRFVC